MRHAVLLLCAGGLLASCADDPMTGTSTTNPLSLGGLSSATSNNGTGRIQRAETLFAQTPPPA